MRQKNPNNGTKKSGLIRWKGFYGLGILLGMGLFYFCFLFDYHLKSKIENIGSSLNQAQVEIGSLKSRFFRGEMELSDFRVANQQDPSRDLFKIDRIRIKFRVEPLFRKKLIIDDMAITGVHYDIERNVSGSITEQELTGRQGLIERVASGFYTELRNDMGENPLRNLGQLLTGFDISSRVENSLAQLESQKKVHEIKQNLDLVEASWEQGVQKLPPLPQIIQAHDKIALLAGRSPAGSEGLSELIQIKTSLEGQKISATQAWGHMNEQAKSVEADFGAINPLIDKDVATLEKRLKLPRLDFADLTPMLLGSTLLTYLERLTYWVDLSRRRMPKGSRDNSLVLQERARGVTVHFGKMAAYPAFLLYHASVKSEIQSQDPSQGKVEGLIEGLTSDPPIYGAPTKFQIAAEFPDRGIEGVKVSGEIDHTGSVSKEELLVSADTFPFVNYPINDGGDVSLHLAKAKGRISAKVNFEDNSLVANLGIHFSEASYTTVSRFKRIEEVIDSSVSGLDTWDLRSSASGPFDHLKFLAASDLGEHIASSLHSEFHHQIGAIEDDLKKNILDEIYPQKEALLSTFDGLRSKYLDAAHDRLTAIQDLISLSDQSIVHGSTGRSVAGRVRHPASSGSTHN